MNGSGGRQRIREKVTSRREVEKVKSNRSSPELLKTSKVTNSEDDRRRATLSGGKVDLQEVRQGSNVGVGVWVKTTKTKAELKQGLIIKTAVVQLERDGYIDKLGKLYT